MSPRTGRPKAEKPKTIEIKARIDEETNKRLVDYCKKNGTNKTEVVRKGIDWIFMCEHLEERRIKMQSFRDINGENIPFEDLNQLNLEEQTDIETGDITAYLVYIEDSIYEVSKKTYEAIKEKK